MKNILENHLGKTLILIIIIATLLPYILTNLSSGLYFPSENLIGDTIGGITAPILGFTNILLLYITLNKQTEQFARQRETEFIDKLLNEIKSSYDKLNIYEIKTVQSQTGSKSLFLLSNYFDNLIENNGAPNNDFGNSNLKAFDIDIMFIHTNISRLLKFNLESKLQTRNKDEIYNTLLFLNNPISMYLNSKEKYYEKIVDRNIISKDNYQNNNLYDSTKLLRMMNDWIFENNKINQN